MTTMSIMNLNLFSLILSPVASVYTLIIQTLNDKQQNTF